MKKIVMLFFEVNGNKVALKIVSSPGEGGGRIIYLFDKKWGILQFLQIKTHIQP